MNKRIVERALRDIEAGDFVESEAGIILAKLGIKLGGTFYHDVIRGGVSLGAVADHNLITNEGLTDLLQVYLGNGTQKSTWYVGIFEGNYTPVATNTAATIASAATESTAYTETTRPEWVDSTAASQQISNVSSRATFTINATKTIYGAFLISDSTKSGTAGKLFSASRFQNSRSVIALDQLLVGYTVQASSV